MACIPQSLPAGSHAGITTARTATPAEQHASSSRPKLKSLDISDMGVGQWDEDDGAPPLASVPGHLVQGGWPLLERLILDDVDIDAQGLSVLIKGNWPLLKELNLGHNLFSLAWLPLLSQAAWPLVRKFSITVFDNGLPSRSGYNHNHNADAISRLMRVGWHLEELVLLHTDCLSINAVQSLVKSDMTSLKCLDLTGYMIDGYSVAMLAESKWPQLVRVRLNTHVLDAYTAGFLVNIDWPLLKHFAMTGISISSMSVLRKGSWPYLETLELTESDVHFGVLGAAELVKGDWPCLTCLNLRDFALDAAGMNLILEMSSWPLLASLDISLTDLIRIPGYVSMLPAFKGRWPLLQRLREQNDLDCVG